MTALAASTLTGSITPLITPLANGRVDHDTYARLIERHIDAGGHGILVNGTTAEPSTLTVAERNALVDTAVAAARGRTQIVAATGSQSFEETAALTDYADRAGVDALLIVTPYYLRPPQRGLVEYYCALAERTERPVLVYHIPGRAAVGVDVETLERIRARADNLVGMKHAVNDLGFVTECLARLGRDFRIFVGLEELSLPMLAVGACGLMNAVGNLAPKPVAQLYEAVRAADLVTAQRLHFSLFELNRSVFFDTNPIPIKYMMKRLGLLAHNEHRLPMVPASPELEARLDAVLARAGLVAKAAA